MALHTHKNFAEIADVSSQQVSVNVTRGNLIKEEKDGVFYFDDQNQKNAVFLRKRIQKKITKELQKGKEQIEKPLVHDSGKSVVKLPITEKKPTAHYQEMISKDGQKVIPFAKMCLEDQKKTLEINKLKETVEIERIKKEKQQGLVIPTDIVINLFSTSNKSLVNKFYAAAEDLGNTFIYSLGGTRKDVIKFRDTLIELTNKANDKATNAVLKSIDGIVDEYSEKRGRGESK